MAALPNMCKMPGPPAPFVPAPLPNVGNSNGDEKGYSTTVLVEGKAVAIKGASYGSKGEMPSKGTGGGLVSATVHGATKIIGPGSMNVKIEGKNVQLLGDITTNNEQNSGNVAGGTLQAIALAMALEGGSKPLLIKCENAPAGSCDKMTDCEKEQICVKCGKTNQLAQDGKLKRYPKTPRGEARYDKKRKKGDIAATTYKRQQGNRTLGKGKNGRHLKKKVTPKQLSNNFASECAHKEWMDQGANPKMPGLSADHVHEIQLGGSPSSRKNLRLMSSKANGWIGQELQHLKPEEYTGVLPDCCG